MKFNKELILIILIVLCISTFNNNPINALHNEQVYSAQDSNCIKIATSFYDWYINYESTDNAESRIFFTKDSSGIYRLMNIDKYMNVLKSLGTLSPKFLDAEFKRLNTCDCYLKTFDWTKFENTYNFIGSPCEFFTYNYWFKSQELAHKVKVTAIEKTDSSDTIKVVLNFYYIDNYGEHKQYFSADEILIKFNENWLIDEIKVRNQ